MKKKYTFCLLFISLNLFSQINPMTGTLNIFNDSQEPFYVYLNGQLQNNEPKTNFRIEKLTQRYYTLKIIFANSNLKPVSKNRITIMDYFGYNFMETAYRIKINPKNNQTKLNFYSETPILPDITQPNIVYIPDQPYAIRTEPLPSTACEMNNSNFKETLKEIKKEILDENKLPMTESLLLNNFFSSKQIADLALCFTFDKSRIIFVKEAYKHCIDVQNYYLIQDTFSFLTYKNEFIQFIYNQQNKKPTKI